MSKGKDNGTDHQPEDEEEVEGQEINEDGVLGNGSVPDVANDVERRRARANELFGELVDLFIRQACQITLCF